MAQVYLNIIRYSFLNFEIPWRLSIGYFHGVDKFLAIPELTLLPDILLLCLISNKNYFVVHTVLMYSLGFLCLIKIKEKYQIKYFGFIYLWLLFSFNGYIVSHLYAGHFMWTGYFILPYLLL